MPTDVQFESNPTWCHFVLSVSTTLLINILIMYCMNSVILGGLLLDILEINLSTIPSIKLLFVYVSFLA
jgi:hypothetical protein